MRHLYYISLNNVSKEQSSGKGMKRLQDSEVGVKSGEVFSDKTCLFYTITHGSCDFFYNTYIRLIKQIQAWISLAKYP